MVECLSVTFSGLVCLLDDMPESVAILQGIISPHADQVYALLRSGCQDCSPTSMTPATFMPDSASALPPLRNHYAIAWVCN